MPELRRLTATDAAEGALSGMHSDLDGNIGLTPEDLMRGRGNFNISFGADGNPEGFTLGQPKRAVAWNLYGGPRPGETTKQNDAPIDIKETSYVFNHSFIDGEPLSREGASELTKPLAPILKKLASSSAGFPASTATSPYWMRYRWGIDAGNTIVYTAPSQATLVPALSQGQSIGAVIPDEAPEGVKYIGLEVTEPGTSSVTTPGTFHLQKAFELVQFPAKEVELNGPFVHDPNPSALTASRNDTTVPPPVSCDLQYDRHVDGYARALENGAFFGITYVTRAGETLLSPHCPKDPGGIDHEPVQIIDNIPVTFDIRDVYGYRTEDPRVIGWHAYLFLNGKWYRHYDPTTGYGKTKPLPLDWHAIITGQYLGTESFIAWGWNVGQKTTNLGFRMVYIYEQEPPGEDQSGIVPPDAPLPTPTVFGATRPAPGHYAFQVAEIDEDGKESEPSDVEEIDIGEYDVPRIIRANRANRIPNATLVERGADGLPLDFTFVQTGGSVDLGAGELIFKTTGAQTGTTPSGLSDPIDINRTEDWSVGALMKIFNPQTGAFAGSFEAVLRELNASGTATDTVLKNGAAVGDHAFYTVISATGGTAPAWHSDTTQAQILYRFSGATKNALVRVSGQILKDYTYRFRRRQEPAPGIDEPANPNPSPQTTAVPTGSTAVEPSPTPESVPETLTQTGPDRPLLSGAVLQTGDLESAMPTGFASTTSGGGALTRETTPTITPLVGSYSLRSRKASGGSLSTAFLSKLYGSRSTTLSGAMTNSQNTVPLMDLTYWPTSGTVYIDSEKITYTGKDAINGAGNLTGCTRAVYGSSAATHSSSAVVTLLGRDSISLYAKRKIPTLPSNGYVTLGELRRWTDGARFAWIDLDARNETAQLTVNVGPTVAGNVTVALDNVSTNVALAAVAEQSRLTVTSGVTQPGGTPYNGTAILSLGGVSYGIPVYGGAQVQIYDVTIASTPGGTGYFYVVVPDSVNVWTYVTVNCSSSDTTAQIASKVSAAINAAAPNKVYSEWWTSTYTSGSTFRITAHSNGPRGSVSFGAGTVNFPIPTQAEVQRGTHSPRLQTERFQVLGNFSSTTNTFFTILLGIERGMRMGFSFSSLENGDTPAIAARKIYQEFQNKHLGHGWNASHVLGSDTVIFTQQQPSTVPSGTVSVPPQITLPNTISTMFTGAENDTVTDVATRIRNTNFNGWTNGNSGTVVDFFATIAGSRTDIAFSGAGGVAATPSTIVQGAADTPAQVAAKIVTAYSGNASWTVTNVSNVVSFVATSVGNKQDATFSAGSTGVQAEMKTISQGSIDIAVNVYDPTTALTRRRRVQTGLTTSSIVNTEIAVQGAGSDHAIISVWGSSGSSTMTLLGWFEGIDLTDYPAGGVAIGATGESTSSLTWDVLTDSIEVTDRGKTYYETHDHSGNLINQVHGHYLPEQKKSQKLLLQGYRQPVIPGVQYTLAGKLRYDGASGAVPFYLSLHTLAGHEYALRDIASGISGTSAWQALIDTGITGTGAWQEFTVTFTAPLDPKCYELRLRSKDISSGEFLIQSLVSSVGPTPLRTPHFATSGEYVATFDISTPDMPSIFNGGRDVWGRRRKSFRMDVSPPQNESAAPTWSADSTYQCASVQAGPYSAWVSDSEDVPQCNILQSRLLGTSDGLSSFILPSGMPRVAYELRHMGKPMSTFLKATRAEFPGGASFLWLKRPQQLKDVVVQRLLGESYDRTSVSKRTGRQKPFDLQVFTAEAMNYITENWADTTFVIEAFGQWYEVRLSAEPDFDPQTAEIEDDGQTYGVYIASMPRAQIVAMGPLS